ncbi:peptidylprolyl isomerase [Exophiala viscosa]|uniref:peptidylprolyl isomerase n=1 Tax=Exophiala viscosa TaxID=2486360 RepID=A0AAN6II74_9EURO|nr:peptidylprolyl isomerase [Exophiala viscosa]
MASKLEKRVITPGNGSDFPKRGDTVTMDYTGWLYDPAQAANDYKGRQFDSSVGRADFIVQIGIGRVIPGWDQGVPTMSLGEKSTLTIPGTLGYGERGFPGLIPPNSTLIFDVHLKAIGNKSI